MISRIGMLSMLLPGLLPAQALTEYSLGSARAATSAAPAHKASKAAGTVFQKTGGALQNAGSTKPSQRRPAPAAAQRSSSAPVEVHLTKVFEEPPPNAVFEDPSSIEQGTAYGEVIRRFGLPVMKLTTGSNQETLSYVRNGQTIDVEIREGKVAAVHGARLSERTAVVKVP
jgi:hypothetical protein